MKWISKVGINVCKFFIKFFRVFILAAVIILCICFKIDRPCFCFDFLVLTKGDMQDIWGHQITVTGIVVTVFLFILEKAKERRLGMSFKYIFFHKEIFGCVNAFRIMIKSVFQLIINFVIAYILVGVEIVLVQRTMRVVFVLVLLLNIIDILCVMQLYVNARYKESRIYYKIRKAIYRKLLFYNNTEQSDEKKYRFKKKNIKGIAKDTKEIFDAIQKGKLIAPDNKISLYKSQASISIGEKIRRNSKLDCKLVLENKEYDSYFGDSVLTLFALYFTNTERYKCLLDNIAVRILQRKATVSIDESGINTKTDLILWLYSTCSEAAHLDEDKVILACIISDYENYYYELNKKIREYEKVMG